jgi:nucleoside-diphosphate kinase
MEQTLTILKPDCVRKRLIGTIISKIEENGFNIIGIKMLRLDKATAESFYEAHRGKVFYEGLIDFMTSGPCCVAVLEKENAIDDYRELMGATNPTEAKANTIRAQYADNTQQNIVHGSDSTETAAREIAFFYSDMELLQFS